MPEINTVCPYCGVGCGMRLQTDGEQVIKVVGDKNHPANFGRLCTKGQTSAQVLRNAGRMDSAFARSQRTHEPVKLAMDEAISQTAQRLKAMVQAHGPDAVSLYVSGQMSLEAQYLANKLCKGFIGTNQIESNSRLCMASASTGYKLSLGADGPPGSYQDFEQADVFLVIGANMADCHPILFLRMMDRAKAGAKLIVVDPRRTATADKADLFMQIKPGTDLALLNGLLHLLHAAGHTDAEFIAEHTEGWEAMPAFLADYTPVQVSRITGIDEAQLREAAHLIGHANNWMSCWTMGLNQSTHGTWNTNAMCNLHLATGAICKPGSGPFSLTGQPNAMGGREMGYMGPGLPGQRSVLVEADRHFVEDVWGLPRNTLHTRSVGGTVAMFERMAAGEIKACWIICTNPVASVANRSNVMAALQQAELVITQDAFLDTETNRYADILLPAALWAEAEGVMINSERNLSLMQQAVAPPGAALPDWQIIARVACEMGYAHAFSYRCAEDVFEEIKRFWNPHTGYDLRGASYARLRQAPLQWPSPPGDTRSRHPMRYTNQDASQTQRLRADGSPAGLAFPTASGKAQFFARPHTDAAEMPDADFPMVLNTGRLQHQWHTLTKTGKIATLNKLNPGPFVELHPDDAAALNIQTKDRVEIRSRRGVAILPAVVSPRVQAGNCFAPFHWGDLHGEDLAINAVVSDAIDALSQQPEFKVSAVVLRRLEPIAHNALHGADQAAVQSDQPASSTQAPTHHMMQIQAMARLLGVDTAPKPTLEPHEQLYLQGFLSGLQTEEARQLGGVPTLPPSAPLAPATRSVVDGMLAGLFSRTSLASPSTTSLPVTSPAVPITAPSVTVLWASQTGNAEAFALQCSAHLTQQGCQVQLASMDSYRLDTLPANGRLLLIASTFGDGDPPDNGASFWDALHTDAAVQLKNRPYAVLAFGDSSYDQFCGFGRKLDARLEILGAQRLAIRIDCEPDAQDMAAAWLKSIGKTLTEPPQPSSASQASTTIYSRSHPLETQLSCNRLLSGGGSQKEVRQIGFDLKGSGLHYQTGDALGVWPQNQAAYVQELLDCMGLDGDSPVTLAECGEVSLQQALTRHRELSRLSPAVLDFVYARSGDDELEYLLRIENAAELKQWLWGRHLADLLHAFPVQAPAQAWVDVLKPLQPRLYSISSSALATPDEVQLTISVLRYETELRPRGGICSTFLADLPSLDNGSDSAAPQVSIFLQKSAHFHPPQDDTLPLVMIGPGTGIAPFRGFLLERQSRQASGKNWLIFGEQRAATDFYYQDELQAMQRSGLLTQLDTAFSRDQCDKLYVQHRMLEHGAQLWQWLQAGAHVYVCGDAARMAKDVDAALVQIVQEHGAMDADAAQHFVRELASHKRYVRDVY